MKIDKINPINPSQSNSNKQSKNIKSVEGQGKDKINISDNSKTHTLHKQVLEAVKRAPDIRVDKIEEAKKTLAALKTNPDPILKDVSIKLLKEFGL